MAAAKSRSTDRERAASEPVSERPQTVRPIYIRLPAPRSRCPWTGYSRSALADLCVANKANDFRPPIKSFRVRRKGDKRAIRLIVFESLLSYLRKFEEEAA
jgi:hypothetical protein